MELHTLIIQGLLGQLQTTFNCPAYFVSTTDRWRIAQLLDKQKNKPVTLPTIFLKIGNASLTTTTYNPRTLARRGMYGAGTDDKNVINNVPLVPVDLQFEVIYLTTDFYESLAFVSNWMFAATSADLNMTVEYSNVDIDIKSQLEPNLTVPDRENSSDVPNLYELSGTLTINGYFTNGSRVRQVDTVRVDTRNTLVVGHDVGKMP